VAVAHAWQHGRRLGVGHRFDALLLVRCSVQQLQQTLRLSGRHDRLHDMDLAIDFIILLGAALNAETEHQTARDNTLGPPKPMGARGATMADHFGKSTDEL
jgi:hypothetical protein